MGQVDTVYASAIFELAKEENKIQEFNEEIKSLYEIFKSDNEFLDILQTPVISSKEKKDLIQKLFKDKISINIYNFLQLLIDKNRINEFLGISEEFFNLYREESNILLAEIYTVEDLSDDIISSLQKKLSELTGKNIEIKQIVDDTILGGIKIKVGSNLIDSSVLNKLNDLEESLKSVSI